MLSKLSQMRPRGLVWIIALTIFLHGAAINGHAVPSPGTKVTPEESGTKAVGFFEEATIGVNVEERAASPGTKVTPEESGTKAVGFFEEATIRVNVEERAASPVLPTFDDHDFERLVAKGRTLYDLLMATIQEADHIVHGHSQSRFTDYNDLEKYGWVNREYDHGEIFYERYGHFLDASTEKAHNHDRRFDHWNQWKNPDNGKMMKPTHGFYENVYNINDRVLYIIDITSPSAMVKRNRHLTAPPLKFWSDVTFLEWAHLQGRETNVHAPKYIAVSGATNVVTRDLFSYIKKTKNIKKWGDLPGGTEFRHPDPIYFALLATPNIYGSVHFLSQHKAQMNIHTIESIKLFEKVILTHMLMKVIERPKEVEMENVTPVRASISSAPTNKIHYNSSSPYSKL